MTRLSISLVTASVIATAVACGAPAGPSASPIASPAPTAMVVTETPAVVYAEATERRDRPGTFLYQLTISSTGEWAETRHGVTRHGRLDAPERDTLRRAIAASQTPARLPERGCQPDHLVITTITAGRHSASLENPCQPVAPAAALRDLARSLVR